MIYPVGTKFSLWVREYDIDVREWVWAKTPVTGVLEVITEESVHPKNWVPGGHRAEIGETVIRVNYETGKPSTQYDILLKMDANQEQWLTDEELPA
jgi:hypothetical protein